MWFKNLHIYRLHEAMAISAEALEERLQENALRELGGSEARRCGWVSPSGSKLHHDVKGNILLTMARQERVLPARVVRREVSERVDVIEEQEGRALRRQERQAIKEQVFEELLPRAFVDETRVDAWWSPTAGLVAVNTSSRKRADELLDLLRETLGSLKVTPLSTNNLPTRAMTEWLSNAENRPKGMLIGDKVELRAKGDDGVVSGRHVDLDSDDVQHLVESGRMVSKMALCCEGLASFTLIEDLSIKSIRFDDAVIEQANEEDDGDDPIARLEGDFLIMSMSLQSIVAFLLSWLGGEAERPGVKETDGKGQPFDDENDPLIHEAEAAVFNEGRASVSTIQRALKIGYNRAARLMDSLERRGVVSAMNNQGLRTITAIRG